MLLKLMKYDLKWMFKVVGIYYILAAVLALASWRFSYITSPVGLFCQTFCGGAAISLAIAAMINVIIRFWVRQIQVMYKDQSHLVQTLPVSTWKIYLSLVVSALVLLSASVLVILLCMFFVYGAPNLSYLMDRLNLYSQIVHMPLPALILGYLLALLLQMLCVCLAGSTGIILGYHRDSGRLTWSFVYGFGIYLAGTIINAGLIYVFTLIRPEYQIIFSSSASAASSISLLPGLLWLGIALYACWNALFLWFDQSRLKLGINVE